MPDANSRDLETLTAVRTDKAIDPAPRIAAQNKMNARRRRILLVQTQAENAGAQEISRLAGAGLTELGYEVHHLFFFRKSDSFDAPPNTIYCWPCRPGNPWALANFSGSWDGKSERFGRMSS